MCCCVPRPRRLEKMLRFLVPVRLAHKEQQRKSGEPYIVHPVAVAELLALLKADWTEKFLASFFDRCFFFHFLVVIKKNELKSKQMKGC